MTDPRSLGALQVAALLISASYGIGFLFGSGEYAIQYGMAGAIYGVATGIGMIALALFAGRLWQTRKAIWDLLGDRAGEKVRRVVALLSVIWMAGVLAAQLHGAAAVVRLLGAREVPAYATAILLIFAASRFELRVASLIFSLCLAASAAVLLFSLTTSGGLALYAASLPAFAKSLPSLGLSRSITISVGVGLLVCTGADYHQFVLAARRPRAAAIGCLLAGVGLLFLAFLPPAMVLSALNQQAWPGIEDPKQVVPQALAVAARNLWVAAGPIMLSILGVAALGSGAAVLRAIVSALEAAHLTGIPRSPSFAAILAIAVATALASSGLSIVDTMVSVNVVYIASVGVSIFSLLRSEGGRGVNETWVIAAGFSAAMSVYLAVWLGWRVSNAQLTALMAGLTSALVARWTLPRRGGEHPCWNVRR